jgi:hypothetical protein
MPLGPGVRAHRAAASREARAGGSNIRTSANAGTVSRRGRRRVPRSVPEWRADSVPLAQQALPVSGGRPVDGDGAARQMSDHPASAMTPARFHPSAGSARTAHPRCLAPQDTTGVVYVIVCLAERGAHLDPALLCEHPHLPVTTTCVRDFAGSAIGPWRGWRAVRWVTRLGRVVCEC